MYGGCSGVGEAASRTGSVKGEYQACVDHVWCSGLKAELPCFFISIANRLSPINLFFEVFFQEV